MAPPRKKAEPTPDPELAAKLDAIDPDPSQDAHSAFDATDLRPHIEAHDETVRELLENDIRPVNELFPEEDTRPPIVAFFEKIGLVKGALYEEVHVGHGRRLDFVVVEKIAGLAVDGDVDEVVITFREDGTKRQYLVRWDYITYLVPRA